MSSHAPSSSPPLPFLLRARRNWRGALGLGTATAAAYAAWELPTTPEAIAQSVGLGLCAAALWAFSRAALEEPDAHGHADSSVDPDRTERLRLSPARPAPPAARALPAATEPRADEIRQPASTTVPFEAADTDRSSVPASDASDDEPTGSSATELIARIADEPTRRTRRRKGPFRFGPETDRLLAQLGGEAANTSSGPMRLEDMPGASGRTLKGVAPIHLDLKGKGHALARSAPATPEVVAPAVLAPLVGSTPPAPAILTLEGGAAPGLAARLDATLAASWPELDALIQQLIALSKDEPVVVGISSTPAASQLKARASCELARVLAQRQVKEIALVETDFQDPALERALGVRMPPMTGFSQQIFRRTLEGPGAPWTVLRGAPRLSILLEGRIRTPGMAHTIQLVEAFQALRRQFRLTVVHGPSAAAGVEARVLDAASDVIVMVVPAGDPGARAEAEALAREGFALKERCLVLAMPSD